MGFQELDTHNQLLVHPMDRLELQLLCISSSQQDVVHPQGHSLE